MGVYVLSDKGRVRPMNEDSYFVLTQEIPLALVADGMGGHKAGEVASALAAEMLSQLAAKRGKKDISVKTAVSWVRKANEAIFKESQKADSKRGMGTTLTMLYFMKTRVMLAHVGDSRAYRLRGGELLQLTQDHSLVAELVRIGEITQEQAKDHPYKNIITRALGAEDHIEVDARDMARRPGDLYLICSDGLTSYVSDEELKQTLQNEDALDKKAKHLLNLALERGGRDNITILITDGEVD